MTSAWSHTVSLACVLPVHDYTDLWGGQQSHPPKSVGQPQLGSASRGAGLYDADALPPPAAQPVGAANDDAREGPGGTVAGAPQRLGVLWKRGTIFGYRCLAGSERGWGADRSLSCDHALICATLQERLLSSVLR